LNGYYLTDSASNKTKWQFPNVSLGTDGYLKVFADKAHNDRDPAQELHTGFSLDKDGEYLGLIAPNGTTVLQEFATAPDVDGNTLLDNTIVVYVTEVARAYDHNQQNVPLLVFGGKNTRLRGGTFLKVTGGQLTAQAGGTGNRPLNDFWLALAPIFGVVLAVHDDLVVALHSRAALQHGAQGLRSREHRLRMSGKQVEESLLLRHQGVKPAHHGRIPVSSEWPAMRR
jgi:hypothetical protein